MTVCCLSQGGPSCCSGASSNWKRRSSCEKTKTDQVEYGVFCKRLRISRHPRIQSKVLFGSHSSKKEKLLLNMCTEALESAREVLFAQICFLLSLENNSTKVKIEWICVDCPEHSAHLPAKPSASRRARRSRLGFGK